MYEIKRLLWRFVSKTSMIKLIMLVFAVAVFIPMLTFTIISLSDGYNRYKHQQSRDNQDLLSILEASIDKDTGKIEDVSRAIFSNRKIINFLNKEYQGGLEDFDRYYYEALGAIYNTYTSDISDVNKVSVFTNNQTIPEGYGIFYHSSRIIDQPWYQSLTNSQPYQSHWFVIPVSESSYYFDRVPSRPQKEAYVAIYASPIYSFTGNYLGVVTIEVNIDHLIYKENRDIDSLFVIFDGQFVLVPEYIDKNGQNQLYSLIDNSDDYFGKIALDDKKYYISQQKVADLPMMIGVIRLSERLSNFFSYWGVYLIIHVTSLLFFSLFLFFLKKLYNSMTQGINIIEQAAKGMEIIHYQSRGPLELRVFSENINLLIEKIIKLTEERIQRETAQKDAQIKSIYSHINPHFFYNTLDLIGGTMVMAGQLEIADKITLFSQLLRYGFKRGLMSTIKDEIIYVESYCSLYSIRYPERIKLTVTVPETVMMMKILRFALQPIIENSIKHGINEYNQYLSIIISAQVIDNENIVIDITDNGAGISPRKLADLQSEISKSEEDELVSPSHQKDRGIGLANVSRRLQLYYGKDYSLQVHSEIGKFTRIRIPIRHFQQREDTEYA